MQTLETNNLDPNFKFEVASRPGGENIKACFSCGTCTATCPVSQIDSEFNPRKIIRQVLLGLRKEVLADPVLWRCVQCYGCYAKCPQNVKFTEVLAALREMAVQEGHFPASLLKDAQELGDFAQELRRDLVNILVKDPEKSRKLQAQLRACLDND